MKPSFVRRAALGCTIAVLGLLAEAGCGSGGGGGGSPEPTAEITSANAERIASRVIAASFGGLDMASVGARSGASGGGGVTRSMGKGFEPEGGLPGRGAAPDLAPRRDPVGPRDLACDASGSKTASGVVANPINWPIQGDLVDVSFDLCEEDFFVLDGGIRLRYDRLQGGIFGLNFDAMLETDFEALELDRFLNVSVDTLPPVAPLNVTCSPQANSPPTFPALSNANRNALLALNPILNIPVGLTEVPKVEYMYQAALDNPAIFELLNDEISDFTSGAISFTSIEQALATNVDCKFKQTLNSRNTNPFTDQLLLNEDTLLTQPIEATGDVSIHLATMTKPAGQLMTMIDLANPISSMQVTGGRMRLGRDDLDSEDTLRDFELLMIEDDIVGMCQSDNPLRVYQMELSGRLASTAIVGEVSFATPTPLAGRDGLRLTGVMNPGCRPRFGAAPPPGRYLGPPDTGTIAIGGVDGSSIDIVADEGDENAVRLDVDADGDDVVEDQIFTTWQELLED